jgi:hypothetical protein
MVAQIRLGEVVAVILAVTERRHLAGKDRPPAAATPDDVQRCPTQTTLR